MHFCKPALIRNPVGGSANQTMYAELLAELAKHKSSVLDYATTPEPRSAYKHALDATARGADLLVAMGGDGTALEVAEVAMATNTPFAVYQGGTGNQFAKSFYPRLPADLFCRMLRDGEPQAIDVLQLKLELDGQQTVCHALVGICTNDIANAISFAPRKWKRIFGRLVYFYRCGLACLNPKTQKIKFETDRAAWESDVFTSTVLNTCSLPLLQTGSSINASDGLADTFIFETGSRYQLLKLAFTLAFKGTQFVREKLQQVRADRIVMSSSRTIDLNIDGEPARADRVEIRVLKGALKVLVSR